MAEERAPDSAPGDLEALRARLWLAVEAASSLLKSRKPELKLKAVHAVSQAAAAYRGVLSDSDLEARLKALEERQALLEGEK